MRRICRNKGCHDMATRRGMCLKHYNQWYRKKHSEEIKAQKKIYYKLVVSKVDHLLARDITTKKAPTRTP